MPDNDRRTIRLEDPAERWEKREGFLTRLVIGWDGSTNTTTQLRAEELQDVVNAAARQYGIRPTTIANQDYGDIAREVLTELSEFLDPAAGLGNVVSADAVRDWMNENYADDSNPEWPGRTD